MRNSRSALAVEKSVLTVQGVAEMLKVCPRTVLNMAKRGDIPASRIGHLWRFEEEEIHHWLKQKSDSRKELKKTRIAGSLPESIIDLIQEDQVRFEKSAAEKREILEDLASLAVRSGRIANYSALVSSLEEREEMYATAMDAGVAFPHPRRPLPELEEPVLAVLVVESGVDFGAMGGGKTHVFVLFCAPNDASHVRILARLARIFHNQRRLISKLRHTREPKRIIELLLQAELDKTGSF